MGFDDQLRRYFGSADVAALSPAAIEVGTERIRVDFGLEKDPPRRFALWSLMFMLGSAFDIDIAFKEGADRDAARSFMDLAERAD